jgi:SAM-dependent methyltransferase
MTCFDEYSQYYDLLYKDRDYSAEAEVLCAHLSKHAPGAESLLEIGCGTGRLAIELVERGFVLHGLDLSQTMLEKAEARRRKLPDQIASRLSFSRADIRNIKLATRFDAVTAMFHVMSYQQTNDDIVDSFSSAFAHLNPGGLFLFDFWYGPAVLRQRPEIRIKRVEDDSVRLIRIAEPSFRANENIVEVRYQILAIDNVTTQTTEIYETHAMRYLFLPEVATHLENSGFELVEALAWPAGGIPDERSWGVACIARKVQL